MEADANRNCLRTNVQGPTFQASGPGYLHDLKGAIGDRSFIIKY